MTNEKLKEIEERLLEKGNGRRDAAIKEIDAHARGYLLGVNDALAAVSFARPDQAQFAADVAPVVHAHWIENSSEYYKLCYSRGQTPEQTEYLTESDVACSACLRKFNITDNSFTHECANYCPNCGAKMDGGVTNGEDN